MKSANLLLALFAMTMPIITTANESLVFFDFEKCTAGTAEDEPLAGNKTYEHWVKKAAELKGNSDWGVFYTNETRMGICRMSFSTPSAKSEIYCRNESLNNFELAGARYSTEINKAGHLLRFKCTSGCKATTPKFLYRAIESDEEFTKGPDEIALSNAYRKYDRLCKRKKAE